MDNQERWYQNYETLKAHVLETGHFPNKHTIGNNWVRYQKKRLNAGLMTNEQKRLFEELAASRSNENTGGRRKRL